MASGSIENLMAAVMALRTAYIAEKRRDVEDFDIETDPTIARLMTAMAEFHEHMKTR